MNNATMTLEFDRQKKIQAAFYTAGIALVLLLVIWFVKFYQPVVPPPPVEETIEIALPDPPPEDLNLGNNDVGSGKVQPIITGNPSSAPVSPDASPARGATSQQATRDFDEDDDKQSPPITKPAATNTNKEINSNPTEQSTVAKRNPKPKALLTSKTGTGPGGNTDDPMKYQPSSGQGPGDGVGDKGTFNGNPKGTKYFGTKIVNMPSKSFQDDFNESGKIVLDISVDENGRLLSATYQPKGSSISNRNQIQIAQRRARELSYPKVQGGFKQPHVFVFDVK